MNIHQFFNEIPKTELHLHLDGAFTYDFLFSLIKKYEADASIESVNQLKEKFRYTDFNHFIETWFWKNSLYREPEDFENSVYFTLKNSKEQNIKYIEAFISPWDYKDSKLQPREIVQSAINGVKRADNDFGIRCKLIIDLTRDHGHETASSRLNEISDYLGNIIVGIGLGGSEQKFPAHLFKDVFAEAKSRGFHVVAHAGEVAGPESIWSAIQDLKVERIGHGVRAVEDPRLVEYLANNKIPLEVCINSNIRTKVYNNYDDHTVKELYKNGVLITISTDDPTMFDTNLTEEYLVLREKINMSMDNILKIMNNSIEASFASPEEKVLLKRELNSFWIQNIEDLN